MKRVKPNKSINITFFYPPFNSFSGSPVRWIPLGTPIIENYLMRNFDNLNFKHFDVDLEIRNIKSRMPVLNNIVSNLENYLMKHSLSDIVSNSNSNFDIFFKIVLKLLSIKDSDLFCFSFYSRDQVGIKSQFLFMKFIKKKFSLSRVVLGGLYGCGDNVTQSLSLDGVEIEKIPFIDYYVPTYGERPMLAIVNSLINGDKILERDLDPKLSETENELLVRIRRPEFTNFQSRDFYVYTPKKLYSLYCGHKKPSKLFNNKTEKIFLIPYSFQQGCFYRKCAYCGCGPSTNFYVKDIADIVTDLRFLKNKYKSKYFVFFNTNFNFDIKFSKKLLKAMIKHRLFITWTDSFNLKIMDDELIELLVKAGCFRLDIGVISFSEKILRKINNIHRDLNNLNWLKKMSAAGLWTHINLITGLPYEWDVKRHAPTIMKILPYVDSYVLNTLRIPHSSDFAIHPNRFGIKLFLSNKQQKFLENGFKHDLVKRQMLTINNYTVLNNLLNQATKNTNASCYPMVDIYLLGYLYHRLGPNNKDMIKKIAYSLKSQLIKSGPGQ